MTRSKASGSEPVLADHSNKAIKGRVDWEGDSSTPMVNAKPVECDDRVAERIDEWLESVLFTSPTIRLESWWDELKYHKKHLRDYSDYEVKKYLVTHHNLLDIDVPKMQPDDKRKLIESDVLACRPPATAEDHAFATAKTPDGEQHPTDAPKVYLSGWLEILDALNLKNDKTNQGRVRKAHKTVPGPIIMPTQGGQPTPVVKADLLLWWNGLEERYREIATERDSRLVDRSATVRDQFDRGRGEHEETVVPEIAGHVKRRRGST